MKHNDPKKTVVASSHRTIFEKKATYKESKEDLEKILEKAKNILLGHNVHFTTL